MFDYLSHAAHLGGTGDGVSIDNTESEVGLEESVHHHAVSELKDLQRKVSSREKDKWEREEWQLNDVIRLGGASVVFLRKGRSRASE